MQNKWILGVVQSSVDDNKQVNIERAKAMIDKAADSGASIVVLPEMFNCPYDNRFFPEFAESFPGGSTLRMLSNVAAEKNIYLFGGSVPEADGGNIYNSCFVFGPDGSLLARHRKAHLFDVELEQGISFKESAVLSPGNEITVVDTELGRIGVAICYDIRFPELARAVALKGASLLLVPAAFNTVTGPAHWELTMRMRAVDNQLYVAAASPARNDRASYVAYGHSIVTDPWGEVLGSLDEKEGLLLVQIDLDRLKQVRSEFPLLKHRRTDMYDLREL